MVCLLVKQIALTFLWNNQRQSVGSVITWSERHFNFNYGITAVCKEILGFPRVDPYDAQEQMT